MARTRHTPHRNEAAIVTQLLIATTNAGKQREYRRLLADLPLDLVMPADLGVDLDVTESGETFETNATLKARAYAAAAQLPALADDSGLAVDALGGFPGVRSSRWVIGTDADRVAALLARLEGVPGDRRGASFRAVVALAQPNGQVVVSAGRVDGRIAAAARGTNGFGYDPVFLVEDGRYAGDRTMAELSPEEKNALSHRARALRGLWGTLFVMAHTSPSAAKGHSGPV
jgi:XTP/dITP diphosphohydrolase